ncbi:hypothetical protein ACIQVK_18790 [Streptomyces sp. NPDC090493]|uniref:hypothetical protein n=1 Tax=Streptomyces sp. NPDC090493 TaxID=3365964 RepID=UPI00381873D9
MATLKCPGSCNSWVIEADEGEEPGEDGYAKRKCVGCQWHDDGVGSAEECGCSDCEKAIRAKRAENWRDNQKLELLSDRTRQGCKMTCQVKTWRLTDESDHHSQVFTIIDSTPVQYHQSDFTGAPSVSVYRGTEMHDCLATLPSLDRARLFIARTVMTGYDTFAQLDTEEAEHWLELTNKLLAVEVLKGQERPDYECPRTFYVGDPWLVDEANDREFVTRRDFTLSLFAVIEHLAWTEEREPLLTGIKSWHDGMPEPTWTDLHPAA